MSVSRLFLAIAIFCLVANCAAPGANNRGQQVATSRAADRCDGYGALRLFGDSHSQSPASLVEQAHRSKMPYTMSRMDGNVFSSSSGSQSLRATVLKQIEGCDQALAAVSAQQNWLRRANLLRARAAYHLRLFDRQSARRDIGDAREVLQGAGDVPGLVDGFLVSLDLLAARAVPFAVESYRQEDAHYLAAAERQPYHVSLQRNVLNALSAEYLFSEKGQEFLDRIGNLSPSLMATSLQVSEWREGSGPEAYRRHKHLVAIQHHMVEITRLALLASRSGDRPSSALADPSANAEMYTPVSAGPVTLIRFAVAAARIGALEEAREAVQKTKAVLKELRAVPSTSFDRHAELQQKIASFESYLENSAVIIEGFDSVYNKNAQDTRQFFQQNPRLLGVANAYHLNAAGNAKLNPSGPAYYDRDEARRRLTNLLEEIQREARISEFYAMVPVLFSGPHSDYPRLAERQRGDSGGENDGLQITRLGEKKIFLRTQGEDDKGARSVSEESLFLQAALIAKAAGADRFQVHGQGSYTLKRVKKSALGGDVEDLEAAANAGYLSTLYIDIDPAPEEPMTLSVAEVLAKVGPKHLSPTSRSWVREQSGMKDG